MSRVFFGDAHDVNSLVIVAKNIADCFTMDSKEVVETVNTQLVQHNIDVVAKRDS